ncbi:MAG: penicillin-binding protein [Firmicutes bacterium]|nr:penicillin-binding protein [Bacillota bacterium]
MKKIERRAIMCLLVAVVLVMGLCVFIYRDVSEGTSWATFQGNRDVYADGKLAKGALYDRHGELLMRNTKDGMVFNESSDVRAGCMHITGDKGSNIATGANRAFLDKLIGYDFVNGIYALNNAGIDLYSTLDAGLCAAAYDAMEGQSGTVGIFNYQTGEILCMVSGPSYDPLDPPEEVESGTYINHFTSSTFAPGSTFKLVTSAAAIETVDDAFSYEYKCTGVEDYGHGDKVTDEEAHGTVDLKKALEVSCNCYFGKLAGKVGGEQMKNYTEKAGLMDSYDINGIHTKEGTFDFPEGGVNLAWTGIGQYHDMVNPCGMMVYVGSIANGGEAHMPYILDPRSLVDKQVSKITNRTKQMIEPETAESLKEMMANNVKEHYDGDYNFPGLPLCAKTGTAEVEGQDSPNSWFVGFLDDTEHPYAFVVLIEKGGYGIDAAGSVANKVLQEAVGN